MDTVNYNKYMSCNDREIHMKEYIDLRMLKHIVEKIDPALYSMRKDGKEPTPADIKSNHTILKRYYDNCIRVKNEDGSLHPSLAYVDCVYRQKSYPYKKGKINFGRYYTEDHSLINIHRVLRHTISKEYYWDIDVKNAHPTFLVWLCKMNGLACDKVEYYINNRDACFADLYRCYPVVDKEMAKMDMLAILNGGDRSENNKKSGYEKPETLPWFKDYMEQVSVIHESISKLYPDVFKIAEREKIKQAERKGSQKRKFINDPDHTVYNVLGTTTNYILLSIEAQCLMIMYDKIKSIYGEEAIGSLQYDGILLSKDKFKKEDLRCVMDICEEEIKNKMDGLTVSLTEKPMDQGFNIEYDSISFLPSLKTKNAKINYKDSGINEKHIQLVSRNNIGLAELALEIWGRDNLVMLSSGDTGFIWNEKTLLWEEKSKDAIENKIIDVLEPHLNSLMFDLITFYNQQSIDYNNDTDEPEAFSTIKTIKFAINSLQSRNSISPIYKKMYPELIDDNFISDKLNSQPDLLPTPDGNVINLRDGSVRKREKTDYFSGTTRVNYNPILDTSFAEKVILEFATPYRSQNYVPEENGTPEEKPEVLANWLITLCGYCLTYTQAERQVFVGYGCGKNGKTVLFETILKGILGETFSLTLSDDVLFKKVSGGCTPELRELMGKRFAVSSETNENESFNERQIKRLTGGDQIKGRGLYEKKLFKYFNQAKVIIIANNPISFNVGDKAMLDRVVQIPFDNQFQTNYKFIEEINSKLDIFFTLFVKGAINWYKNGLAPNGKVVERIKSSTQSMVNAIDNSFTFINEKCTIDRDSKYLRSDIYRDYIAYMNQPENRGEKSISKSEFFKRMTNRFGEPKKVDGNIHYKGIGPRTQSHTTALPPSVSGELHSPTTFIMPEM